MVGSANIASAGGQPPLEWRSRSQVQGSSHRVRSPSGLRLRPDLAPDGGAKSPYLAAKVVWQLDRHFALAGLVVAGAAFTVADVPIGPVLNRWLCPDFKRPYGTQQRAYRTRPSQRQAYRRHVRNGLPRSQGLRANARYAPEAEAG